MQIKPLTIGNLELGPPVMLAPMAGYTDYPFRMLCRRYGAELVFTEVTMAGGLNYKSPQTLHYFVTVPEEQPVVAHIYGADPGTMARAAALIEELGTFQMIDINCGCPVRKIVRKGAGVALMGDPQRIHDIVSAVKSAVSLPVTIKTRLGLTPETENVQDVVRAATDAGAAAVFIHARFASARHAGPADWDALARIKQSASIPVIGNGGVDEPEQALDMLKQTGVDGVMVGRAALGRPWVFREIRAVLEGRPAMPATIDERRAVIEEHFDKLHQLITMESTFRKRRRHNAEQGTCRKFRAHLVKYLAGLPGMRNVLRQMQSLETKADVMAAVDSVLKNG